MILRNKLLLLSIFIFGLALRVVNLQQWFHFEMDEETIAWKLRPFLEDGKLFLIGGGTPFGFHLGPAFYYLSSLPLKLAGLNPIGWGWAAAFVGTLTIWCCWLVGKTLFNRRVGLIFALLWATSFVAVASDRHWWPLVLDPILALVVILALFKNWWVILGLALAFGWQADLTVLPLFLTAGAAAVFNFRKQKRGILIALGILCFSFLPLVLFEIRHPGANLGKLLQRSNLCCLQRLDLYGTAEFITKSLSRVLFPITNLDGNLQKFYTWCREIADGRVSGQPGWAGILTALLLLMPFFGRKFKKQDQQADKILGLVIISTIAGILIFKLLGGNLYDFYLAVLYPVVLILAARAVDFIWRKRGMLAGGVIVAVIVGLNLTAIAKVYHPQSLLLKRQAAEWVNAQVGSHPFALESLSQCSRYNGARYVFRMTGNEPVMSFMDPSFFWLYPQPPTTQYPERLVVFVTPADLTQTQQTRYNQLQTRLIARAAYGEIEIMMVDNHDNLFSIDF